MSKAKIEQGPGVYRFTWEKPEMVVITVNRVRQHSDRTSAEVLVETAAPGIRTHLHQAQLNLTSTIARKKLGEHLVTLYKAPNWGDMLEELCFHVLERLRRGEPVILLDSEKEAKRPEWALSPICPKRNASILFGKGGSAKSILAMTYGIIIEKAWGDNGLAVTPGTDPMRALYLDWEMNEDDAQWRLKCITRGTGLKAIQMRYRRCVLPLSDDAESIQEIMLDEEIGFVVIDSVFGAAGGDLNATEPAQRMFQALRQLNVSSLLIAHCAKNADTNGKEVTPFGTAFYWNEARSIWEIQKQQEQGEKEIDVGLFHKKSNFGGLHKPLGYHISFTDDSILVRNKNVAEIPALAPRLCARDRIIPLLEQGKMSVKDLAAELDIVEDTLYRALRTMEKRGEAVKVGDDWGLLY